MKKSAFLALGMLSACMGGSVPVVLSGSETLDEGTGALGEGLFVPGLGHESFALLLNDTRVGGGVTVVAEDARLSAAAQAHAADMVDNDYLSHTDLTGGTAGNRALAVGYDWNFIAENIARGFVTEESVVAAWMNSAGHRDNMLDTRAEDFGLGLVGDTWVLMLGREFPEG